MHKVNLAQKLQQFSDRWNPRIVGELNGQQIKVAKLEGEFRVMRTIPRIQRG